VFPAPYAPPHVVVALSCLALSVGLLPIIAQRFLRVPVGRIPRHLCRRIERDCRAAGPWRGYWAGLLAWATAVSVLHFGGLEWGLYARLWWWDLLTHLLSGVGVGGILLVGLRDVTPAEPPVAWPVLALGSIGAGFEVYEYVYRSFWHTWTLWTYTHDTVTDLLVGCLGGLLALGWYRSWVDADTDASPTHRGRPHSND
jgi:hypothetical protein